jgi:hypothetical protein
MAEGPIRRWLRERREKTRGSPIDEGELRESYRTLEEAEKARRRGRIGYEFVRIESYAPLKYVVVWRRKPESMGSQISDHRKEQIKALLEQHIPPLEKDFTENATFYRRRLPPEYEIADFYEKLLTHIYDLKRKYEAELAK